MSEDENCVVRIVNLEGTCTKVTLKQLILTLCQPSGDIKNIYLKKDDVNNIFYGYVVFEYSYDAAKMIQNFNGFSYGTNAFEVELIGPNLHYRKFLESKCDVGYHCGRCSGDHHSLCCPYRNINSRIHRERGFRGGLFSRLAPKPNRVKETEESSASIKVSEGASNSWKVGSSYSNIYISNINYTTTDTDFANLVKPFGPIKRLSLGKDKETGRCKGYAHVNFKFRGDASEAISQLDGMSFNGRTIKAQWARE